MTKPMIFAAPLALAFALTPLLAQAQPAAIDPCSLLTAQEVSAAIGKPVEPGKRADDGITRQGANSTTCLWQVALPRGVTPDPTKSLGGREFAILNIQNWPGGPSDARKFLDGFREAFAGHAITSKPVEIEVGADEALWWGDGVAGRKAGVSFGISVASAGDRALRKPRAEGLAKLIAERLAKRSA